MIMKKIKKSFYVKLINLGAHLYRNKLYILARFIWCVSISSGHASQRNIMRYLSILNNKELRKALPKIYFNLVDDDIAVAQLLTLTKKRRLTDFYRKIKLSRVGNQNHLSALINKISLSDLDIKVELYSEILDIKLIHSDVEKLIYCVANNVSIDLDVSSISESNLRMIIKYCNENKIALSEELVSRLVASFMNLSFKSAYCVALYLSKVNLMHVVAWGTLFDIYPDDTRVIKNYINSHYKNPDNDIAVAYKRLVELISNDIRDNSRYVYNQILIGNLHKIIPLEIEINRTTYLKVIDSIRKTNDLNLCNMYVDNYLESYGEDNEISTLRFKISLQNGSYQLAKEQAKDISDCYYKALSYLKTKDVKGAIKLIDKIEPSSKNYSEAQIMRGDIEFYEFKNYKKALRYYQESNNFKVLDYQSNIRMLYCKMQLNEVLSRQDIESIKPYELELIKFSSMVKKNVKFALSRFNKIYYSNNVMPISVSQKGNGNNFFDLIYCVSKKRHSGPLISIIMTTFNCKKTVDFAIESILNQSYRNIEFIIVDDCSTDDTYDYLVDKYKGIRIFRNQENSGTYVSKNFGITKAKGQYITFMDSDDWSHPERIYCQVKILEQQKKLMACMTDHVRMFENGTLLIRRGGVAACAPISIMIRRQIIDTLGFFDSVRCSGDSEFISRIKAVYGIEAIFNIDCPLLIARQSMSSLTTSGKTAITWIAMPAIRLNYKRSYLNWQKNTDSFYMPYNSKKRLFFAPNEII